MLPVLTILQALIGVRMFKYFSFYIRKALSFTYVLQLKINKLNIHHNRNPKCPHGKFHGLFYFIWAT
jgi:hypothetical protein